MALELAAFAGLALALGFKHAFDADHVLAVGGILARPNPPRRTLTLASSWAVGHMVTAMLVSAALYFFAQSFLASILGRLEVLVAAMLIVVGLAGVAAALRRFHLHKHAHAPEGPSHRHFHLHLRPGHQHGAMAGIGVVHGLASNDELLAVLLVGLGASAWWHVLLGVLLFSVGVWAGMGVYAMALQAVAARPRSAWIPNALQMALSLSAIGYGVWLLAGGIGVGLLDA